MMKCESGSGGVDEYVVEWRVEVEVRRRASGVLRPPSGNDDRGLGSSAPRLDLAKEGRASRYMSREAPSPQLQLERVR